MIVDMKAADEITIQTKLQELSHEFKTLNKAKNNPITRKILSMHITKTLISTLSINIHLLINYKKNCHTSI